MGEDVSASLETKGFSMSKDPTPKKPVIHSVLLKNKGQHKVYVGTSNVKRTTGIPIAPGAEIRISGERYSHWLRHGGIYVVTAPDDEVEMQIVKEVY